MPYFEPKWHVERVDGRKVFVCRDERSARMLVSRAKCRGQRALVTQGVCDTFSTLEEGKRTEFPMRPVFFVRLIEEGESDASMRPLHTLRVFGGAE